MLDSPRRQVRHEVDEQNARLCLERQGHIDEMVDAYRVVELLQIDHGEGCVHSELGCCFRHCAANERTPERRGAFNCLIPRSGPLPAPRLHGGLADLFPNTDHHWKQSQRSV